MCVCVCVVCVCVCVCACVCVSHQHKIQLSHNSVMSPYSLVRTDITDGYDIAVLDYSYDNTICGLYIL